MSKNADEIVFNSLIEVNARLQLEVKHYVSEIGINPL